MSNKELSLTLRLNIDPALDGQLDSLLTAVAAAVTPLDGYEHVDQQWWQPCTGCDWLDRTLDAIRTRLAAAVTEWYRSALAASPAVDGPAVPQEGGEAGELVQWLEHMAQAGLGGLDELNAARAATLLQQQATELARLRSRATLVPVPVGERPWERQLGWRDLDGECWWCLPGGPPQWRMANPAMVYGGWLLPSWAIPHPPQAGEVEG